MEPKQRGMIDMPQQELEDEQRSTLGVGYKRLNDKSRILKELPLEFNNEGKTS